MALLTAFQRFQQPEEACSLSDAREFNAERLDLQKQVLHIDDLVPYQALQKDANQPHQSVLHVLVLHITKVRVT